jgi:3-phosphoshikimate 1-carboxyvinyltransferase
MSSFNIKRLNKPFDVVIENIASDNQYLIDVQCFHYFQIKLRILKTI